MSEDVKCMFAFAALMTLYSVVFIFFALAT